MLPSMNWKSTLTIEEDTRKIELTAKGRQMVRSLPRDEDVRIMPLVDLYDYTERAIKVHRDFHLDRQYVVRDGEIVIVDEFTGRLAEGRKWRDGIHQAIEAKEGIEVTIPTGQAAHHRHSGPISSLQTYWWHDWDRRYQCPRTETHL